LEHLVGGAAQPPDAQDGELAEWGIELAAMQQRVAHAGKTLHAGLGVGEHAVDVEMRFELLKELGVPAAGAFDVEIRYACHRLSPLMLLSPVRGRGWERGRRTSIPPHLASPPTGGAEDDDRKLSDHYAR